jgi:ribosomal protein S18 acetylase RimI-like enzyme
MMNIRSYQPRDLPAHYRICLATGAAGEDASHLTRDALLVGHVFAAPYAILAPQCCFVAEDEDGVGGYIVGAADTEAFEKRLEAEWWPALRSAYPPPPAQPPEWTYDLTMMRRIHRPFRTPDRITNAYPSHLHINLLPHLQGHGFGTELIDRWLSRIREQGSHGAHLAVGIANPRAIAFYRKYGFRELERTGRDASIVWFGMAL